jgi:hypothetical protein
LGDPDWKGLTEDEDSYATGVPVGLDGQLPRTPAVFRRKTLWRKVDESEGYWDVANFTSAAEAGGKREELFRKDESQGRRFPTSLAGAKPLYPVGRLRIAAQGAVQKPDGSFRPLDDAMHGVKVNNGIRPRDQRDLPGPADEAARVESSRLEGPVVFFGLAADIRQAHRSVRHRKADWGILACFGILRNP